ncbi:MAG TPA: replication-relaxation family protein [Candidatus Saccharimonadales bacterium]|nr:replication-relaxation family protein [Candidatus Saccharimonadales bacterium]
MKTPITKQQRAIMSLLYEYRFLHRRHVQVFLQHKSNARVALWLKDLREKGYVAWFYSKATLTSKNTPAVYFLSRQGLKVLQKELQYPPEVLRVRAKDAERSQTLQERHLLIADACLALKHRDQPKHLPILPVHFAQAPHNSEFLTALKPHLFFEKQVTPVPSYFVLELLSASLPTYRLTKRLRDYLHFLTFEWDDTNGHPPTALFICPTAGMRSTVERYLRKILHESNQDEMPSIRLTTLDRVRQLGIAGAVWEPPLLSDK